MECSFCGTNEKDVEVLVEGQDVYICDKCVISADEIVKVSQLTNKKGEIKLWISKESYLPVIIEQNSNFGEIILQLNNVDYEN